MGVVAVRKKVVSIGHFSPSFCLQFFFHLLYQIKSYCINWLHWKLEKNRTEQNKLDKLEYLKSFIKTTSYAHWHAFLYLHAQTCIKTFIHLSHFKSEKQTELNELNELKCSKTPSQMSSYAHKHVFLCLHAQTTVGIFFCPLFK